MCFCLAAEQEMPFNISPFVTCLGLQVQPRVHDTAGQPRHCICPCKHHGQAIHHPAAWRHGCLYCPGSSRQSLAVTTSTASRKTSPCASMQCMHHMHLEGSYCKQDSCCGVQYRVHQQQPAVACLADLVPAGPGCACKK